MNFLNPQLSGRHPVVSSHQPATAHTGADAAPPFSPLKYRIEVILIERYGKERGAIKKFLANWMKVSVTTIQSEISIAHNEVKRRIPPKRLRMYAKFFDCSVDELRNNPR